MGWNDLFFEPENLEIQLHDPTKKSKHLVHKEQLKNAYRAAKALPTKSFKKIVVQDK